MISKNENLRRTVTDAYRKMMRNNAHFRGETMRRFEPYRQSKHYQGTDELKFFWLANNLDTYRGLGVFVSCRTQKKYHRKIKRLLKKVFDNGST